VERKQRGEGKLETFGFLGFTHICDVTQARGKFIVLRQTIRKRMGAKLREIEEELRDRPHSLNWEMAGRGGGRVLPLPRGATQPACDAELLPKGEPALAGGAQLPQPQGGHRVDTDV
jgi:hypothetical protein